MQFNEQAVLQAIESAGSNAASVDVDVRLLYFHKIAKILLEITKILILSFIIIFIT